MTYQGIIYCYIVRVGLFLRIPFFVSIGYLTADH